MVIEVMSKENLREYAILPHKESAAVISIANPNDEFPQLCDHSENGIIAQCKVIFYDVEYGMRGCITDDDADKIASFVNSLPGKTDRLIVQCEYGVSRSAGVASAIMKALTGDDVEIWRSYLYRPNVTCYRKVLTAFRVSIDEQELQRKIACNRELYERRTYEKKAKN